MYVLWNTCKQSTFGHHSDTGSDRALFCYEIDYDLENDMPELLFATEWLTQNTDEHVPRCFHISLDGNTIDLDTLRKRIECNPDREGTVSIKFDVVQARVIHEFIKAHEMHDDEARLALFSEFMTGGYDGQPLH
jgi:hypothetical protein